jgi:predicted SnoaL-like aldol condensation-catalyzing enzyme
MDPKLIVIRFIDCINAHDVDGLAALITEDHTFIDREGNVQRSRATMVRNWTEFIGTFPGYRNTITRIEDAGRQVAVLGHAFWSGERPYDPVIWTATVVGDRIREWRVYPDTPENRARFRLG